MGFGGSVQSMISSIKNNRALLRRKNIYEAGNRNEAYKYKYKELRKLKFDKTATKAQLESIRAQAKLEQKQKLIKVIVLVAFSFCLLIMAAHFGVNHYIKQQAIKEKTWLEQEAQKKQLDFEWRIEQAEQYFKSNEWLNASIAFRRANALQPLSFKHELLLCRSMYYNCKQNKVDCFNCIDLIEKLLVKQPDNAALLAMQQQLNSGF